MRTDAAQVLVKTQISTGFANMFPYLTLIDTTISISSDFVLQADITYSYGVTGNQETVTVKTALFNSSGDIVTEA